MPKKPNRSPESIEQRRAYARERSRRRYREEKEKVLEEIAKYKKGDTYKAGAKKRRNNATEYQRELRDKKQEEIARIKSDLSCASCGFDNPDALDFHHNDPTEKELPISRMVSCNYTIEAILLEIEKCTVLCANCHRILHAQERREGRRVKPSQITYQTPQKTLC